jgi:hypothetical protein
VLFIEQLKANYKVLALVLLFKLMPMMKVRMKIQRTHIN